MRVRPDRPPGGQRPRSRGSWVGVAVRPVAVITDPMQAPQGAVTRPVSVTPHSARRPSRWTDEETGVPLSELQSPESVSRGAGAPGLEAGPSG